MAAAPSLRWGASRRWVQGAIYLNKERGGRPHFGSWHGLVGIGAAAAVLLQFAGSVVLLFPQRALGVASAVGGVGCGTLPRRRDAPVTRPQLRSLMTLHRVASFAAYTAGMAALMLGFQSTYWAGRAAA